MYFHQAQSMRLGPNWYQIGNKTRFIPKASKFYVAKGYISMLTGFKVSSLPSKCVFYRPEHKANGGSLKWNFEVFGMQRWVKPTDRVQRVDEKNGVKMFKKW